LLSSRIDVAEKTPTIESRTPSLRVDAHTAHSGKIDYESVIARTESSEAMTTAANRRQHARCSRGSHCRLHIRRVHAARDQARPTRHHAIPNAPRSVIFAVAGTQQIATEFPTK
jgi:hypothetical protein